MPFRMTEPRITGLWSGWPPAMSKTRMSTATAAAPIRPAMRPSRTIRPSGAPSGAMDARLRPDRGRLAVLTRLGPRPPEKHHRPGDQVPQHSADPHEDARELLVRLRRERPGPASGGVVRVEEPLRQR